MSRVGPLQIDDCIFDAIRDNRLVIFAGAGVSMGAPANLPDFNKLACDIAAGTMHEMNEKEPIDRFLGRVAHGGVDIYQRAAQRLAIPDSKPTDLHANLLMLFGNPDSVRLVTTNFDLHFETAAKTEFGKIPEVFRAPALPLGRDFRGIVHVHGALTKPSDMVLTDADFGRGYLTEGWARRFLVDVFRHYTVLFIGYSHSDVVMNYLARALPHDGTSRRYALTDHAGDWNLLGVSPILFRPGAFEELYEGVRCLTERVSRGALDWQTRLAEVGNRVPPIDDETVGEIEQALREVHTTRFLLNVARHSEWPQWLDTRKYLDALFEHAPLNERDRILAHWLAEHFSIERANEIIQLIAAHNLRLNQELWMAIARQLGSDNSQALDSGAVSRWVSILLASAPSRIHGHPFLWLAVNCARHEQVQMLLEIFLFMGKHHLTIKPRIEWPGFEDKRSPIRFNIDTVQRGDHYSLNEMWQNYVQPRIAAVAQPLLSGITRQLEEVHCTMFAWEQAGYDWDLASYGRYAIEPHTQDQHREPLDVLIDAARDALKWMAGNQPYLLDGWMERLVVSDVPLLRRLAIHALTVHPEKNADDKLFWLIKRIGLNGLAEHHEIYRAASMAYPVAGNSARQTVIDSVRAIQLDAVEGMSAADRTARAHFEWLDWLEKSDPSCPLIKAALSPIKVAHPTWEPKEYPDLTHWVSSGWGGAPSPWTVEQLVSISPAEQLDDLLSFKGSPFQGPDRPGLALAIREACSQDVDWALRLMRELSQRELWESDLWAPLLWAMPEAGLKLDDWKSLLTCISREELQRAHTHDIANLLLSLVRDGGKPFAAELLDQANGVAVQMWNSLVCDQEEKDVDGWLSQAINRPAGAMVNYWIQGLSVLLHGKHGMERSLPDYYRHVLTDVVQNESVCGGMGRSLLASQVSFLSGIDEAWVGEHIIPLFTSSDRAKFYQAWDGFLVWGQFNTILIEALKPGFLQALKEFNPGRADRRRRLIEFFTALAVLYIKDPTQSVLPALFRDGSLQDRLDFTSQVGFFLRGMEETTRRSLWNTWLRQYWVNRLQSVPSPLEDGEISGMLDWLPHLGDAFPDGVSLAIQSKPIRLEHNLLTNELRDSPLVDKFPDAAAELIIWLCSGELGYHKDDISVIVRRLSQLDSTLQRRLKEALARAGIDTGGD